jgi:hypothetical protein
MIVRSLRRLLLRIDYSLPRELQKSLYRWLYDGGEPPRDSGQIKLTISNEPDSLVSFEFVGVSLD